MRRNSTIILSLGSALLFFSHAFADEGRLLDISPRGELIFEHQGTTRLAYTLLPDSAKASAFIAQHKNQLLRYDVVDTDRYQRANIIVYTQGNTLALQQQMLRNGLAVLYHPEALADGENWMQDEAIGRDQNLGFWSLPNSIIDAAQATAYIHKFALVQGNITTIYRARDAYYINFGEHWRNDFSIKIPHKAWRSMEAWITQFESQLLLAPDPKSKRMVVDTSRPIMLRVRGAIRQENGPMIVVNQPQQLEILRSH